MPRGPWNLLLDIMVLPTCALLVSNWYTWPTCDEWKLERFICSIISPWTLEKGHSSSICFLRGFGAYGLWYVIVSWDHIKKVSNSNWFPNFFFWNFFLLMCVVVDFDGKKMIKIYHFYELLNNKNTLNNK